MCISIKTALKTAINFAENSASSGIFRHLGFKILKILLNPRWRNMPDEAEFSAKFIAVFKAVFIDIHIFKF